MSDSWNVFFGDSRPEGDFHINFDHCQMMGKENIPVDEMIDLCDNCHRLS